MAGKNFNSLRAKFARTLLLVTGIVGASTLVILVLTSVKASARELASVKSYIEEGITSEGRVLTENHALALRSLTLDNAFLDMQRLIERAVIDDDVVVYGLYVNVQGEMLAYSRRGLPAAGERPVEVDPFGELKLPPNESGVDKPTVKRTARLGEELLEVAVPVIGEEREVLGTIRYGLSTRRTQEALARARADARAQLWRSVLLASSLIGVASLLGLLLSRSQGARITRPIAELTQAARELAAGNRGVRVKIESGDEIELLGASFNRMVGDLDASYGKLEDMNRTLEQKVEQRTRELFRKNRDMRLLLDNVDQGFLTLSPSGQMSLERSRAVIQWFGEAAEAVEFWRYIEPTSHGFASSFQLGWEQLMEGALPLEVCLAQLPELLESAGRTWQFRYLPFHREGELEGVLVMAAEITERLAKEAEEAGYKELMESFKRLVDDRSGFASFLQESAPVVDAVTTRRLDADAPRLKRAIHTLKGNAASMGLSLTAQLCHALESEIANAGGTSDAKLAELAARWGAIMRHVAHFVGTRPRAVIEVPEGEYAAFVERLSQERALDRGLLQHALAWRLEPVERPLQGLAEHARGLAGRLGKPEPEIVIEANGVRLNRERLAGFFSELVHVVRNAVDHGIESEQERIAAGKPRAGRLVFRAQLAANVLTFEIGDDGRGIDWEALADKARELGLERGTTAELLAVLCREGVTTRSVVTSSSGRGIGMAALKQKLDELSARLEVHSVRGQGTRFVMHVPCVARDASALTLEPLPRSASLYPESDTKREKRLN